MTTEHLDGVANAVLARLKGFQRKTAAYAFDRLYRAEDSTRRFLIADEVGLGKTLIAAGVIAQAIEHLNVLNTPRIDVLYICSNQAIARQNVDRLRGYLPIDTKPLAQRITLLPYRLDTLNRRVNLIALTPGTSFMTNSAEGVVEERIILFRMLTQAWGDLGRNARTVFLGSLRTVEIFRGHEARHPPRKIDASIEERFRRIVGGPGEPLHCEFVQMRDRVAQFPDSESRRLRLRFVARLRRLLADACLDALEPDLIILDEFQRFKELLDTHTPSGELAQRLFEYEDSHTKVRTLLLSATPYKMYTLSHEADDNHYRDFLRTVRFLEGPSGSVEHLRDALQQFRSTVPQAAAGNGPGVRARNRLSEHRNSIQTALLRVMSRTERRGRAAGGDPMLEAIEMDVNLRTSDVEAFLSARELARSVDAPGVMEYWKSAPYLLSFMDRYQLADRVRAAVRNDPNGPAGQIIRRSSSLQLQHRAVEQRRTLAGGNGRMRAFLRDLTDSHLHELLWLPPALPTHSLGRGFERARAATKRLTFSSWAMVPRAIAVMGSYDAERRYIPDASRADHYSVRPLRVTDDAYSVFALLAPSATLADAGDALRYPRGNASNLIHAIRERLRPAVDRLTQDARTEGPPQRIWYAVAPLLLDGQAPELMQWLQDPPARTAEGADRDHAEPTAWRNLVVHVKEGLTNPAALGRPPRDLLEVMAALAAGSPANATLRALSRTAVKPLTDDELKRQASRAAHAFLSLFRTPEAEGLLRNVYRPEVPGGSGEYWRRVLAYSLEGGLSDVLDEYFYVVTEATGAGSNTDSLVNALCQTLQLATGSLRVYEWERKGSGVREHPFQMHQHFARRYVSDGLAGSDQQASEHLDMVRSAFNSPFWPFVLGTTSVGQEGLDFHWYCHAVVHWNLPSNPVDLEQREGRVHRYHGHAIRKNLAQAVGSRALDETRDTMAQGQRLNPWESVYRLAEEEHSADGGLTPHWVFTGGDARIQRHTPVLPLSRDVDRVVALRRSLAVYRMVFGQPRQDDLLEFILREVPDALREDLATSLTIDLSPPV